MSTPDRDDGDVPIGVDPSDLASHAPVANQQPGTVCRWRTARYHDQECARYFDCPSHHVERALSDNEQELEEDREEHQEEGVEPEGDEDRPDSGAVSPLSDDGGEHESHQRARSPSPVLPSAATAATDPRSRGGESEGQHGLAGMSDRNPIMVTDSSSDSDPPGAERASGVPLYPVPGPMPRGNGAVAGPQVNTRPVPVAGSPPMTLVQGPAPTVTERSRGSEVRMPRWQPDSEVTYCPICSTQFSIWVRKHHCRKCGRVVCNACSPHRITIPHQYIVRPPGAPLFTDPRAPVSPLDSPGWYPGFSGGERVRLCNPCVPDPNVAPPQIQGGHTRPPGNPNTPTDSNTISNRWGFYFGGGPSSNPQPQQPGFPQPARPTRLPFPQHAESRILSGTPPAFYQPPSRSQPRPLYPGIPQPYRSMLDVGDVGDRPGPSTSSSSLSDIPPFRPRRIPHPQPPPAIPEEDECPVCHRELPPRTLANFESLREAHINICITAHSTYGSSSGGAAAPSTATGGGDDDLPLPPMQTRRTGMFPYRATEKDCVDSAECSICLEEFEVGVAMARLECLCRFHRRCIGAWWERHPGRCPMHQHDGFGY